MKKIFWASIGAVAFTYIGYPLTMKLMPGKHKSLLKSKLSYEEKTVTLIVTVYNGEKFIEKKLMNCLELNYPSDKLQIIVVSDGSTDKTNTIACDIASKYDNIEVVMVTKGGKEKAQKKALAYANGEIIMFTDVTSTITSNSIKYMVENFADPSVGAVASVLKVEGDSNGDNLYIQYEMKVREINSRFSLTGMGGCFFACRAEVAHNDFSTSQQSDFRTTLVAKRLGYRTVLEQRAIATFPGITDVGKEHRRKVRTTVRALNVLFNNLDMLNIKKYGIFSYQFFSHKVMKWLVPAFMTTAFVSNGLLAKDDSFYRLIFALQLMFYAMASLGIDNKELAKNPFFKIPTFFVNSNSAIAEAWLRYYKGERMVSWKPTDRKVTND